MVIFVSAVANRAVKPFFVVVIGLTDGVVRWSRNKNLAVPETTWKVSSSLGWMWKGGQRGLFGPSVSDGADGAGGRWFVTR